MIHLKDTKFRDGRFNIIVEFRSEPGILECTLTFVEYGASQ